MKKLFVGLTLFLNSCISNDDYPIDMPCTCNQFPTYFMGHPGYHMNRLGLSCGRCSVPIIIFRTEEDEPMDLQDDE